MSIWASITNLRWVIHMYKCEDLFLYEIVEDYKDAGTLEKKNEIFEQFCSSIWSSSNKRRTYIKSIKFNVRKDLLHTEIGRIFDTWSSVEYKYYKSITTDENWYDIIRQKINNIYTVYFDKEIILKKEYMDLLKTPKRLYYKWLSGIDMEANSVTEIINEVMGKAEKTKEKLQSEKMSLSWNEYKKVVEGFLKKCFDNCKLIEEYEDKSRIFNRFDFISEDHFYIGYICKSLDGYFKNYQKTYYNVRRGHKNIYSRCEMCGALIERTSINDHSSKYCTECKRQVVKEQTKKRVQKYRDKNVTQA